MSANRSRPKPGLLQMEALETRLVPYCPAGTLAGYVYVDANDNGVRDPGEQGIAGVPIELRTMDAAEDVVGRATTGADGHYMFTGLASRDYIIEEMEQPAGYADGYDAIHAYVQDFSDTTDELCVPLKSEGICENNFGERPTDGPPPPPPPALAKIGGSVYLDADDDGVFDAGEQPIAGVTVKLEGTTTGGGMHHATTTTAADGSYRFTGVPAGTYHVCETQPAGYADGKDTVGFIVNGTDGNVPGAVTGNDCIGNVTLTPGACGFDYNFGERPQTPPPPAEVTGREGLTPGFWKNNAVRHDGSAWAKTDYFMYQSLGSVFNLAGTPYAGLANKTLVQALSLNGGGVNALMRHAVAALLNASHPDVDYPLTTTQIVSAVNSALASGSAAQIEGLKDQLDGYNNLGADLDQHGRAGSRR